MKLQVEEQHTTQTLVLKVSAPGDLPPDEILQTLVRSPPTTHQDQDWDRDQSQPRDHDSHSSPRPQQNKQDIYGSPRVLLLRDPCFSAGLLHSLTTLVGDIGHGGYPLFGIRRGLPQ